MKDARLSCRDLCLTVGQTRILDHATLELPLDGLTILRGHNGVGKTCFLRALTGLLPLQGGTLSINGQPPSIARRHCGYMPQKADDTAPMIPVLSHVMVCLTRPPSTSWWRWLCPGTPRRAATTLLETVGAGALAHRPLGVLSGGERQRVALAQALASRPDLLILDEPFAALDENGRNSLLQLFVHLHQKTGTDLLITVHGPLETGSLSLPVRTITLAEGELHV